MVYCGDLKTKVRVSFIVYCLVLLFIVYFSCSSTVLVSISEFLINNGNQDSTLLKHLKDLITRRNDFLYNHKVCSLNIS